MTRKQLSDLGMIEKANNGIITVKEAAEAIGLSTRQIKRLKQKVKEGGAAADCVKTPDVTKRIIHTAVVY